MDIRYLKGVGEKRAAQLARLGIRTVDDLLGFYPRDYVDYSHPYPVAGAPYDVKCVVRATVYGKNGGARIRGGRQMAKATAGDDTASLILTYFNNPYALQKLEVGREYLFFGKVGGTFTAPEMVNPVMLTVESAAASPTGACVSADRGREQRVPGQVCACCICRPHRISKNRCPPR